jgi:cytochrome c-type biogenesis protein CcmH
MIWFWIIAGLLVLAALAVLLRPLLQGAGNADHGEAVPTMFRRQLAAIDADIADGRLTVEEAAALRSEIARRMLAATDQAQALVPNAGGASETSSGIAAAVVIAALLPTAALAIYATVGTPAAIGPARPPAATASAEAPHDRAKLEAAADELKTKLEREPGHLEGWVLLGRTFASLQRFADARDAYNHAIALAPKEPRLHAELGELLVATAEGNVTPEAQAEFAKSGDDPRARFYGAEAALQRGDRVAAATTLKALLADAPANAPWRDAVAERLAEIVPGAQPSGSAGAAPSEPSAAAPSGPTAQDVAAAQAMSPEERQAMIRGMVDRLAARLEHNPNDKEGWVRLAHAYDVLGETDKAASARARAAQIPSGN